MENKYNVTVFTKARLDVYSIVDYWENTLGTSASPFINDYEKAIISLSSSPFAHHQPSDKTLREKGYRVFPIRNYYIFYIVVDNEVQIHRILYNKMDFLSLL